MAFTSAWKRRPFLSISTTSPGAMPFDVRRWRAGAGAASGGRSKRASGTSARLDRWPDRLQVDRQPLRARRVPAANDRGEQQHGRNRAGSPDLSDGLKDPPHGSGLLSDRRRAQTRLDERMSDAL